MGFVIKPYVQDGRVDDVKDDVKELKPGLPSEDKKRKDMFAVALKVIDDKKNLEKKVQNLPDVDDISSFRREFNAVMSEVFNNIVPKTMPLNLRNSWSQYGLNRFGVAMRSRYSSRYDSHSMFDLLSQKTDSISWHTNLSVPFKYSDKSDEIPKEFKGLSAAQIYLKNAIDLLEKSTFRTRKRSIERLKRVEKFVVKHEELLKKDEDMLVIPVGECYFWNGDKHYYSMNSVPESAKGFVTKQMFVQYIGYSNLKMYSLNKKGEPEDEFDLMYTNRKLDHAFAFANIYFWFDKLVEMIAKEKETCGKVVEDAIADLRSTFAKELLVAKAKRIGGN